MVVKESEKRLQVFPRRLVHLRVNVDPERMIMNNPLLVSLVPEFSGAISTFTA
jgi:hypothetical protein